MVVTYQAEVHSPSNEPNYDRKSELQAFDETKTGVKGLVDAGITKVPTIFIQPPDDQTHVFEHTKNNVDLMIPVIDLYNVGKDPIRRKEIVCEVREASAKWGFFQVVNHGIEMHVLEEIKNGGRGFFELDSVERKKWYTRDRAKRVVYTSNLDLYLTKAADWRDNLYCLMAPHPPKPHELPQPCREVVMDYSKQVMKLSHCIFELLSESLGLSPDHLKDMGCCEGLGVLFNYYPASPQPELTIGTAKHVDGDFITVLLQDEIGGLQILHDNHWVDVSPLPGALLVNVGDFLQVMSNDEFKSVEHRVLTNNVKSRLSVACFLIGTPSKIYGPIKELLSDKHPPKYREMTVEDYIAEFNARRFDGIPPLLHFKI